MLKVGNMNDLVIHNRVKQARVDANLSQEQLAKMVGTTRMTIYSIEQGTYNPTVKLAMLLCVALNKKFEELFYF